MQLLDLLHLYEQNPRKFSNNYMSFSLSKDIEYNDKIKVIDSLLHNYYILYGYRKFNRIFYHIKHNVSPKKCKICGKETKFQNFTVGYKTYCSLICSRSDGSKTSPEMIKVATEKRNEKMKELLNDPIKGKEYRDKISIKSKAFNSLPAEKLKRSILLKEKISKGLWTPKITNSWTHWDIRIDDKNFRSSFEGLFYIYYVLYCSNNVFYEKLRIPYTIDNESKIYIVDFIDEENKIVFEIKPKSLTNERVNLAKEKALVLWCDENSFSYKHITEDDLKEYINAMKSRNYEHIFIDNFLKKYKW